MLSPGPGMISPPPMLMPTPVQSQQFFSLTGPAPGQHPTTGMTSPLLVPAAQPGADPAQPAMAFTYVPVPVYNVGGAGGMPGMMPGMPGMMPNMMPMMPNMPSMNYSSMSGGATSPDKGEKPDQPAATSTPMSPGASNLR